MSIQLDLFDSIVPVATFDWGPKRDLKIFEYSEDLSFTDPRLEKNYIIDVPCYKLDSLVGIVDKSADHTFNKIAMNKELNNDCVVRVFEEVGSRRYKVNYYILANAKTKKFIEQHFLFAKLKGDISKMPRITRKVVEIQSIDEYRDDLDSAWVMAKITWAPDHILRQIKK